MAKTTKVAKKLMDGYNIVIKQKGDKIFAAYSPFAYPHEIELKRVTSIKRAVWHFKQNIKPNARSFSAVLYSEDKKFAAAINICPAEQNAYRVYLGTSEKQYPVILVCILENKMEAFMNQSIAFLEKELGIKLLAKLDYKTYKERKQEKVSSHEKENTATCV